MQVMVGRALGGLSCAGGSVTLGMIPDMYEGGGAQQYAVAYLSFASVTGSVIGPVVVRGLSGTFVFLL